MNQFCRALAQIVSSTARNHIVLHRALIFQSYSTTTTTTTTTRQWTKKEGEATSKRALKNSRPEQPVPPPPPPPSQPPQTLRSPTWPKRTPAPPSSEVVADADWPRPTEIPFQAKVANSVNLIGYVHMPVQFEASPDGKYWAGTIITQEATSNCPPIWIPIIFEGDLAHVAASHLKEDDYVYVTGKLSADPPPFNAIQGQANVQVMVHNVNFVQGSSRMKKSSALHKQEVLVNHSAGVKKDEGSVSDPWRDLLDNPEQWWDYRNQKLTGMVKPKYPDFKQKNGDLALWLNTAPKWALSKLEGIEFDVQNLPINKSGPVKAMKQHKGVESWKNLVENPEKWWDNRLNKKNARSPDFKHKETGEALWLSDSPAWALSQLPSPKGKQGGAVSQDTLLS